MIIPILTSAVAIHAIPSEGGIEYTSPVELDVFSCKGRVIGDNPILDIYTTIPFEHLQFTSFDGSFLNKYTIQFVVRDTTGRTILDTTSTQTIVESSYNVTRGKTGKSDNHQHRLTLAPNTYDVEVFIVDQFAQRTFSAKKRHTVRDYNQEAHALSSILFVSDVEQKGNRYSIIPYIGEPGWQPERHLFAFFEYYTTTVDSYIGFSWEITSQDLRTLASGISEGAKMSNTTNQAFVPIIRTSRPVPGDYVLTVRAHPAAADGVLDTTSILASTSRSYRVPQSMAGNLLKDLRKAIKQMMYVAGQDTIDSLLAIMNQGEQLTRFENYWRTLDPTPSTTKNEALEEYYGRIDIANERFRSYNEGWLTDMGRVYIIYGEPYTIETFRGQNGLSIISRWTYGNGITIMFDDPSGFGDFRLRGTLPGNPKYVFRR